jgi:hypothetical protein
MEGRGGESLRNGVRNVKVLEAIYRIFFCLDCNSPPHYFGQKTCSKEFYQPLMLVKTIENVFLMVQTTVQKTSRVRII